MTQLGRVFGGRFQILREELMMTLPTDADPLEPLRFDRESGFLADRTILVAGGSGNVGRYITAALLEADARVIVPTRSPEKLEEIRQVHGERSDRLVAILGDITDEEDGKRILDEATGANRVLEGAVASLGTFIPTRSILSARKTDLSRAVEGYLMAHHGAARNLVPRLRQSNGSYIMIQGPLAFDIWSPAASLVSVATAAQAMLARAIMKEEAASEGSGRVRVHELVLHSAVGWEDEGKESPLAPIDIGRYVALLTSSAGADICGRTIHLRSPDQVRELASARG